MSLVALDADMDTCVVGWSSVDSCRAKGLNETICSLMPVFSDVTTLRWQCPFKNETKVSSFMLAYTAKEAFAYSCMQHSGMFMGYLKCLVLLLTEADDLAGNKKSCRVSLHSETWRGRCS